MSILSDVQQLELPAEVELYEMDLAPLGSEDIYRFYDGTNIKRGFVVWRGETYTAFPIKVSGFERSTNGQLPRPKMQVANTNNAITALMLVYNDLVGAKITRKRTLAKYLDAVNFPGDTNPDADPDAAFADDVFFIDRKALETDEVVELEIATVYDVAGVRLPRRTVMQNLCPWRYRGAECGYSGPPRADINDQPLAPSLATTPEEVAYFTTKNTWLAARNTRIAAQQNLAAMQNAYAVASEYVLLENSYDDVYPGMRRVTGYVGGGYGQAVWDDAIITLDATFRQGAIFYSDPISGAISYYIQRWGINTVAQAAALANYNTALAALTTAQTNETTAYNNYQTAIAAVPEDGALFAADKCGHRLSSCKLRFQQPDQSGILPFGGFPAVGLVS